MSFSVRTDGRPPQLELCSQSALDLIADEAVFVFAGSNSLNAWRMRGHPTFVMTSNRETVESQ